jgi:hypothetical protein
LSEVKDLLFVFRLIRHKCLVILNGAVFSGVPSDRSSSLGWLSEVKDLLLSFFMDAPNPCKFGPRSPGTAVFQF